GRRGGADPQPCGRTSARTWSRDRRSARVWSMSEPQHPPTTQDLPEERSPQAGAGTVVLLVADPGLPTDRAESIREELQQRLEEVCEAPVRLDLRTSTLRLRPDGTLDLSRATDLARSFGDTDVTLDRKSTRLNSSHVSISYSVFFLKKKTI